MAIGSLPPLDEEVPEQSGSQLDEKKYDNRRRSYPVVETSGVFDTEELKSNKKQYIKQILFCIIVASGRSLEGVMIGSPASFPKLTDAERSSLQFTSESEHLLISCAFISGLSMNLFQGYLFASLGPRTLVLIACLPPIFSFIMQAVFLNVWMLFIGRLVVGSMCAVMAFTTAPLITELCNPKIRGFLTSLPELFTSLGLLYVYVCVQYLPYQWMTGLCALPFCGTLIGMFMVPESPYWLVTKEKLIEAEKSMKTLHGSDYQKALMEIQLNIKPHSTFINQAKELRLPQNYKPVLLIVFMNMLKVLSGFQFIFSYAGHLFEESDIPIDSSWCPILIGTCRLMFTLTSAIIVDFVGRRPLLLFSCMACGISLLVAGLATYFDEHITCVVSVLMFTCFFSLGVGPTVVCLCGELIPIAVKAQGLTLVSISLFLSSFLTTLLYPKANDYFGLDVTLYICTFFNFGLFLFVIIFLPETRNASLCDIKNAYEKENPSLEVIDSTNLKGLDNLGMEVST